MSKSKVGAGVGEVDVVTITPTPTPDVLPIPTPTTADGGSESLNTIAPDETLAGNTEVGEAEATGGVPLSALAFHNYSSTRAESRKSSLHANSLLKNLGEVPADFDSSKFKFSNSPFVRNFLDPVAAQEDFLNCLADYRLLLKKKKEGYNSKVEEKSQDDYAQNLPGTSHQNQKTGDVASDGAQSVRGCESMDVSDVESISDDIVDKDNLVSFEVLNPSTGGSSKDGRDGFDLPGPSHRSFSIRGKEDSVKLLEEEFSTTNLDIKSEIGTAFPGGFISANDIDPPVKDNVEIKAEKLVLNSDYQAALATATTIEICIEPTYADGEEFTIDEVNLVSPEELTAVLQDSNVTPSPSPVTYHMEMDPERVFLSSEYEAVVERACEPNIFIEPKVADAEQIVDSSNETKYAAGDILADTDAESVVERVDLVVSPDPEQVLTDKFVTHKVNDLEGNPNNPAKNDEGGESLQENYADGNNVSAKNQSEGSEAEPEPSNLEGYAVVEEPNVVVHPIERMVIKIEPYSCWAMYDSMPDL